MVEDRLLTMMFSDDKRNDLKNNIIHLYRYLQLVKMNVRYVGA